jgi:hypothetical protein
MPPPSVPVQVRQPIEELKFEAAPHCPVAAGIEELKEIIGVPGQVKRCRTACPSNHRATSRHQRSGIHVPIRNRCCWHVCAWRRTKIRHCQFLDTNYGEDAAWVAQARQHVTRAHHIDAILHTYRHDARTTLAPEV